MPCQSVVTDKINESLVISSDCQWLVMSLHVVLWELLLQLHTLFLLWCFFVDHEIVEEERASKVTVTNNTTFSIEGGHFSV